MKVFNSILTCVAGLLSLHAVHAHFNVSNSFRLDVHSHVIPEIWRQAVIDAGYPIINGTVYVDGFPFPPWNLTLHIADLDDNGIDYAAVSITAPGLSFLAHNATASSELARAINQELYGYMQEYPTRIGAMCLLPMPHINESIAEINYCMNDLNFSGIGLYSNFNGTYLGDPSLWPVFEAIQTWNAPSFVHPVLPGCTNASAGYPSPLTEYPFDSVRAMESMLLEGTRARFPDLNIIFPHGGGAVPYLAVRIASTAAQPFMGSFDQNTSFAQLKSYYFDTASAFSVVQLAGLKLFGGVSKIVTGTDFPYIAKSAGKIGLESIQVNGNFTDEEMGLINGQNALGIFPRVVEKLGLINGTD